MLIKVTVVDVDALGVYAESKQMSQERISYFV